MADKQHGEIVGGDGPLGADGIHITHNYTFANVGAQNAQEITASDVGKICYRTDLPGFFLAVAVGTGFTFWRRIDSAQGLSSNRNQVAHGFILGDVVYSSNGVFLKAQADDFTTQGSAVVTLVADVDNFTVSTQGGFLFIAHGFTINAILYCSPDTPGLLTEDTPSLEGSKDNPMAFVFDANSLIVIGELGERDPMFMGRLIAKSNTSASALSTDHALQAGDGTDQHIKIGGIVIGCYNGSNNPTAMDYDALRVRLNTNSSTPWQFRNPNDIDLAANYNCRFQFFSSTGGVLRGETGFLGAEGFIFRNNQTNTARGGYKFEMADPIRFISLQRTICIIADTATLSSNTHAFQIGADAATRTAFSGNKAVAITSGGAQDSYLFDCSVFNTETVEMSSTTRAVVVPRVVNEAAVVNTQDGAIFYDTTANAFKFRENGAWVTGSGLA